MSATPRSSLMHRYLDPASSLGEIVFGLAMTLTFTLGAGIIIEEEGREGVRDLLIAIIGCNIAWGTHRRGHVPGGSAIRSRAEATRGCVGARRTR